ncbi:thermonuclease family protein [Luminiphilus sp.]|nr:thermonuclease family protein [Luminiphilus sp.]
MSSLKCLLVLFIGLSFSAIAAVPSDAVQFKLKRILDGDTVVTTEDIRIRLWGIDTPERDQSYGSDATEALTEMLHDQQLYLETKDVDRYGRTVGVIYTADGDEINLEMVCDGHAWWYERYAKRATDYEQCQEDAQKKKRGLWVDEEPIAPWEWRRR